MSKQRSGVYNIKSKEGFRKHLLNHSTSAEAILWTNLKNRQLDGKKFRRQHSIGPFIVDFDRGHFTELGGLVDSRKEEFLRDRGIRVIRFQNRVLFDDIENVLLLIREAPLPPQP